MQRTHPFLSPTGITAAVVVLLGLVIIYGFTGGQMFNPGPLAAAHADIEDCASCHQPLSTNQGTLCMDCHSEIKEEIKAKSGLHAKLESPENCRACHEDHKGTDFDLRATAREHFDHDRAAFSLIRHTIDYESTVIACQDCHMPGDFAVDLLSCVACHDDAAPDFTDQHIQAFGLDCLDCHDGLDRMSDFDHARTSFPLEGEHQTADCADCHGKGSFTETKINCAACHAEPDSHTGMFQSTCEECHSPSGWTPALLNGQLFDHFTQTGFSLVRHKLTGDENILNCSSCHVTNLQSFDSQTCVQCHTEENEAFMAQHQTDYGENCIECHDGLDSMQTFDHAEIFVLDGAHSPLACTSCHIDHSFAETPANCSDCHGEPELHAGLFGLNCANCHSTSAWQPAALSQHTFPLNHGGEGEIACATCHPTNFVQFTCDRCHAPAEMREEHSDEDIFDIAGRCLECHPTGLEDERDD